MITNRQSLVDISDLGGVSEVSNALRAHGVRVSTQLVCNWRNRYEDFPRHVTIIGGTRVYLISRVVAWYLRSTHQ